MGVKVRIGAVALLSSALLIWAESAQAKELSMFRICGPAGCTAVTNASLLRGLIRGVEAQGGEARRVSTPPPVPFLRLEYWVRGDPTSRPSFVQYYLPSRGIAAVMTGPGSWSWVEPGAVNVVFRRVSKGVTPFPTPRLSAVAIGHETVREPASYIRLFTLRGKADDFPGEPDWQRIVVDTDAPSPWSTAAATLEYSKSTNVLWRGNEFVQVDSSIASRIEARKSLIGPAGHDSSFPWTVLFGGIGGAAVVVPTAVFFRRRRIH
jgi:hypothetical protein